MTWINPAEIHMAMNFYGRPNSRKKETPRTAIVLQHRGAESAASNF
ncbi:hypothetical protein ACKC9G_05170 [Pokkaliibacter sp. CJK22405]